MSEHPTLFEWAGGRAAFDRLINAFYDRVLPRWGWGEAPPFRP